MIGKNSIEKLIPIGRLDSEEGQAKLRETKQLAMIPIGRLDSEEGQAKLRKIEEKDKREKEAQEKLWENANYFSPSYRLRELAEGGVRAISPFVNFGVKYGLRPFGKTVDKLQRHPKQNQEKLEDQADFDLTKFVKDSGFLTTPNKDKLKVTLNTAGEFLPAVGTINGGLNVLKKISNLPLLREAGKQIPRKVKNAGAYVKSVLHTPLTKRNVTGLVASDAARNYINLNSDGTQKARANPIVDTGTDIIVDMLAQGSGRKLFDYGKKKLLARKGIEYIEPYGILDNVAKQKLKKEIFKGDTTIDNSFIDVAENNYKNLVKRKGNSETPIALPVNFMTTFKNNPAFFEMVKGLEPSYKKEIYDNFKKAPFYKTKEYLDQIAEYHPLIANSDLIAADKSLKDYMQYNINAIKKEAKSANSKAKEILYENNKVVTNTNNLKAPIDNYFNDAANVTGIPLNDKVHARIEKLAQILPKKGESSAAIKATSNVSSPTWLTKDVAKLLTKEINNSNQKISASTSKALKEASNSDLPTLVKYRNESLAITEFIKQQQAAGLLSQSDKNHLLQVKYALDATINKAAAKFPRKYINPDVPDVTYTDANVRGRELDAVAKSINKNKIYRNLLDEGENHNVIADSFLNKDNNNKVKQILRDIDSSRPVPTKKGQKIAFRSDTAINEDIKKTPNDFMRDIQRLVADNELLGTKKFANYNPMSHLKKLSNVDHTLPYNVVNGKKNIGNAIKHSVLPVLQKNKDLLKLDKQVGSKVFYDNTKNKYIDGTAHRISGGDIPYGAASFVKSLALKPFKKSYDTSVKKVLEDKDILKEVHDLIRNGGIDKNSYLDKLQLSQTLEFLKHNPALKTEMVKKLYERVED